MKSSFGISIPQPCSEKWNGFSKTSLGGFCGSCQKEVIDFTTWSDEQIKLYFKNRTQPTCGRFGAHQLKTYTLYEHSARTPRWMPLSALGLTMMLALNNAQAQTTRQSQQTIYTAPRPSEEKPGNIISSAVITGTIMNYDSLPLADVMVALKGKDVTAKTDEYGRFTLTINNPQTSDTLVFSHRYYESVERAVNGENNFSITMMERETITMTTTMGMIMTSHYIKPTFWQRIKNIFRRG